MYRPASRVASVASSFRTPLQSHAARRLISTAPPHQQSRSWKSSAARWGLAGGLVYYYNTSTAFAEEPPYVIHAPPETSRQSETYPTVASISEQRRAQSRSQPPPPTNDAQSTQVTAAPDAQPTAPGSPEQLEEEAGQEGAFNEETGEINWDCPCLGGMAHGPCGEQFRAAFSCFVFSKEEPKGVDCIEHFKTMQNCFREHPDVYGAELDDDEEPSTDGVEGQSAPASSQPAPAPQAAQVESTPSQGGESAAPKVQKGSDQEPVEHLGETKSDINRSVAAQIPMQRHMENDTDEELVPKAWHDSRDANNTQGTKQSS